MADETPENGKKPPWLVRQLGVSFKKRNIWCRNRIELTDFVLDR